MSFLNEYKKATYEDKFFRDFVACRFNHNEVWAWFKRNNRRSYRRLLKEKLAKEIEALRGE